MIRISTVEFPEVSAQPEPIPEPPDLPLAVMLPSRITTVATDEMAE
jgi:hypothetical protein